MGGLRGPTRAAAERQGSCARLLDVSVSGPEAARLPPSSLVVRLLGRPRIDVDGAPGYRYRSRKSWALLAFLLLGERPPTRSQLASLLFAEADDPLGALRWCLAEIRRALGPAAVLDGDPVRIVLPAGTTVDVEVLVRGHWSAAVQLPGLGDDLLDGLAIQHAEAFESWLLSERRRLAAATESILHEAALGLLAHGDLDRARDVAVRAALMSPLDENHQALLIRIYRFAGDDEAAQRQFEAWASVAHRELGAPPGAPVLLAMREGPRAVREGDAASIQAVTEAGVAAVSAGALAAGVSTFENAVRLADRAGADSDRIQTRLVLAEALIHTLGGLDEAGLATLTEAERIGVANRDH
jgi:DNA-binding SARP family transcriptional activator